MLSSTRPTARRMVSIVRHAANPRRAEETIRLYADIVKNVQIGLLVLHLESRNDAQSFRLVDINPAAVEFLGAPRERLLGKTLADFPELLKTDLPKQFLEVVRTGKPQDLGEILYGDELIRHGTYASKAFPLPNQCLGIAFENITERKRAEAALRETEERFRLLVQGVKDYAIFMLDPEGRVLSWNTGAERIKGYPAEEIIGKHLSIFYLPEEVEQGKPEVGLREAAGAEGWHEEEGWRVRKDGSGFWANVATTALRDEHGNLTAFAKVTRDVTERMRAEKALRQAEELENRTAEITLLSQLGNLLQACMTTEEAYNVIAQSIRKLFPAEAGAVCVINNSRNVVESVATWGNTLNCEQVFAPEDCWALRSGHAHLMDDPASAVVCRHVTKPAAGPCLCVPMMAQGDALGVLHIQSEAVETDSPRPARYRITASKQELAITVAEQIALSLANLRLRETLRVQAIRDPLTGLFNRRYMEESLEREVRRGARNQRPLGAIMLDLDHLKTCNDSLGHEAGDALLRELAGFLLTQVRGEDIACRYGGDEFMLILPDASLEITLQRAEQLRKEVKGLDVQFGGRPVGLITVSLGVTVFPTHATTAQAIVHTADEALFQAKAKGRDRVELAKLPPAEAENVQSPDVGRAKKT
jgi:diguanylate cyclase (GGDEF)-like protein/PAS domain S-box-containing protein